jgi:hypothetical protein
MAVESIQRFAPQLEAHAFTKQAVLLQSDVFRSTCDWTQSNPGQAIRRRTAPSASACEPYRELIELAGNVAAEDIQNHIQVVETPLHRPSELVMSQLQSWLGPVASSSGF